MVFLSVEVGALLYFSNGNIDVIESGELKNPSRLSSSTWSYPTFRSWAPTWIVGAVYFYFLSIEVVPIILQEGYFEKDPSRLFSTIVYGFCGLAATFYFHDKSDNDRARQAAKQDDGATENDLPAMSVAPKGENDQHKRSMHFSKDDMLRNTSSLPDDGGFMDNMVQRIVSQQGMYGDFFTSFTSAVATPCVFHDCGLLFHKNEYSVMETLGPLLIAAMMFMTALFSFVSIFYNSKEASYASFASCLVVSSLVCFYQWPTQIADGVLGNFAWHLVMVTANTSHSRFSKVAMALLATTSALTLSYLSPIYTLSTNFPFIFGFMGTY